MILYISLGIKTHGEPWCYSTVKPYMVIHFHNYVKQFYTDEITQDRFLVFKVRQKT